MLNNTQPLSKKYLIELIKKGQDLLVKGKELTAVSLFQDAALKYKLAN